MANIFKKEFKKANESLDGEDIRFALDFFRRIVRSYSSDTKYIELLIKSDIEQRLKKTEFKKNEVVKIKNAKFLTEEDLELWMLIKFCNTRSNRVMSPIWHDRFGWKLIDVFR